MNKGNVELGKEEGCDAMCTLGGERQGNGTIEGRSRSEEILKFIG